MVNLRKNKEIRAPKVRLIDENGEQVGVVSTKDALIKALAAGLDLVEIAPNAVPPVCKIIDFGKLRYEQTKRKKESQKAQTVIKVKEVKLKPNIDTHDLEVKVRSAIKFLEQGNKVKLTMFFRGREMAHVDVGQEVIANFCVSVKEVGAVESPAKQFGRTINVVIAPIGKKHKA